MIDSRQTLGELLLKNEIEQFYSYEVGLLDDRQFTEWIDLFTDDARYFLPIRRTVASHELETEFTEPGQAAYIDDDKSMLEARVRKLETGYSWSEDPPSRTRHLITNVRVLSNDEAGLLVASNFLLYRTRLNSEEDMWIGSRQDRLRRSGDSFQIADRKIFLEQTVLLSRNLSNFF